MLNIEETGTAIEGADFFSIGVIKERVLEKEIRKLGLINETKMNRESKRVKKQKC